MLNPSRHTKPLRFFLAVNGREVKWLALMSVAYSAAMTSMLVSTYYLSRLLDVLTLHSSEHLTPYLIYIVLGLVGYEVGFRIGHTIEVLTNARIRARTKRALFDHLTSLSYGYFVDRFSGQIAHKITATTDAFERMALTVTNDFIETGAITVISAVVLAFINIYLGLFLIVWGIVFSIGIFPYAKRMNARANRYADAESRTSGVFVDFFTNIAAVKVYGQEGSRETVYRQIEEERKAYRALGVWAVLSYNYMGLSVITLGTGLLLITTELYVKSTLTIGAIVFIAATALRIFGVTWDLGKSTIDFIRQRGECAQNLSDLVIAPTVIDGAAHADKKDEVGVEYRDVTFSYGSSRAVLKDFSLTVEAGDKVGIVGLSGAGKTTFANLLLRFFDPQEGAILLNGQDIRNFTQEHLRSNISYISQDTSLFHTTIAENIAYGAPAASEKNVKHAAALAYADEFITALPKGYESVVGERGIKLSGGQRQRIAIARAILADRPVFLLDEATSALDSDSEAKIQKGLATLMEGKTVIAIAHRLSTLSHLRRIIFLEAGKIVEDGTHEELLARGGKYAQLWNMQAGGFLPVEVSE